MVRRHRLVWVTCAAALAWGRVAFADPPPAPTVEPASPPSADPPSKQVDPDNAPEPDDQLRAIGEPEIDPSSHRYFPLNVAFLYPFATNIGDPNRATNLDLGLLFTKVGYVDGLQTGVLASVTQSLRGAQIGLGSITEGPARGLQVGGAFALADAPFQGLQIAGIFAWSRFSFDGVEIAGVANQVRKHFAGLQLAGGVNIARKTLHGVQIAGFMNIGRVRGFQMAPLNISSEVDGVQIGIINIARKVRGIQIGLVNVTDDLQGESFAVASVPRAGGIHGVAWGSNSLYGNLGVKFASLVTYTIVSAAFTLDDDKKLLGPSLTFGVYRPLFFDGFFGQFDVGATRLFVTDGPQRVHDEVYKMRLVARYALVRHLSVFVGGGAYLGVRGKDADKRVGPEFSAGLEL